MKDKHGGNVTPLLESEISELLRCVAIQRGLRIPSTPEDVTVFEEAFADEIAAASTHRPDIESVLARAKQLRTTGSSVLRVAKQSGSDSELALAARNGKDISPDTESKMQEALAKTRTPRPDGDDR